MHNSLPSQPPVQCLRVGLVHWACLPTTGGVESHLAELARFLAKDGCSVTVITGEPSPIALPGVTFRTTKLLNLDLIRNQRKMEGSYQVELRQVLAGVIAEERLDVVHGHNLHHFAPQPALALDELRLRMGFRLHHTFHETWPDVLHDRPVYRLWEGNYAVSCFVQEQCAQMIGFKPELLHLGVDPTRFHSSRPTLAHTESIPVILHPARLLPWKGVHVSVHMLVILRQRGVLAKLILTDTQRIADWNGELLAYREQVLKLITSLGLEDLVVFRTASYDQMPSLYEEADLVVYPTVGEEPFGLVPLEAMSTKRPIVASHSGGIPETIVDGQTGYIVEPGDPQALADRVQRLLTDSSLARRMGEAGRAHVMEHFNIERYVKQLMVKYQPEPQK